MILEIALGIVLAVLILAFLPALLALGGVLIVVAAALALIGVIAYFVGSTPALTGAAILAAIGLAIYDLVRFRRAADPIAELESQIARRRKLGYDTRELEQTLSERRSEAHQAKKAKPE